MELDQEKLEKIADAEWVKAVSSIAPLTKDEQAAVDEYQRRFPKERRQLRAFYHERYGQYWLYEPGWPQRQIGCVFPDQIKVARAA